MNYHTYFTVPNGAGPVQCCIIGTGGFGLSFLAQSRKIALLRTRVAIDLDANSAAAAMVAAGYPQDDVAICRTRVEAKSAWDSGRSIAADDISVVLDLPIDVVVEATGHPEAGARHARLAIDAGFHLALVSKEVDSVIGPELARRARQAGRVVTPVDGDQPSLLIGMISWAQILGLEIVAAGKSSEYDFVFDPADNTLSCNGRSITAPDFASWLDLGARACPEVARGRAEAAAALPQRAVPDLCELAVVANSTGLMPDRSDLHAPIARIVEVADFLSPSGEGGLLQKSGTLDVFHCLRLPGEPSFAGGVFLVIRAGQDATWSVLAEKGHVMSRTGDFAMLYLPRHLLGVEAATSILEAGLKSVSSGAVEPKPIVDLVAYADQDLPAGTVLTASGHHHSIVGVSGRLVGAFPMTLEDAAPFYIVANRRLKRSVSRGSPILLGDVELDDASELLSARVEQDGYFFTN